MSVPTSKGELRRSRETVDAVAAEAQLPGNSTAQQELLQSYMQLQERYHRCTEALASAAHDLKTPLAILSGYIELLQNDKLGPLTERQRSILQEMQASSARLDHFIQDFLTFSVLETGELTMKYESGSMNACLSEICNFWAVRFQQKGVALYFLANEKVPTFIFDYAKVQRVVSNLLDNAAKFTPAGGTVWLHAEPHMWERRSNYLPSPTHERRKLKSEVPNSVKVSVSDTGPGIAAEFHQEIFGDFFRLPQAGASGDGVGLGLAIARRLVQAFGGKIWVESEQGAGCKFCFLLPLRPVGVTAGGTR